MMTSPASLLQRSQKASPPVVLWPSRTVSPPTPRGTDSSCQPAVRSLGASQAPSGWPSPSAGCQDKGTTDASTPMSANLGTLQASSTDWLNPWVSSDPRSRVAYQELGLGPFRPMRPCPHLRRRRCLNPSIGILSLHTSSQPRFSGMHSDGGRANWWLRSVYTAPGPERVVPSSGSMRQAKAMVRIRSRC